MAECWWFNYKYLYKSYSYKFFIKIFTPTIGSLLLSIILWFPMENVDDFCENHQNMFKNAFQKISWRKILNFFKFEIWFHQISGDSTIFTDSKPNHFKILKTELVNTRFKPSKKRCYTDVLECKKAAKQTLNAFRSRRMVPGS